MFISLKSLKQQTFKIEVDESELVRVFKEKIEAHKGNEFPANCQKLLYEGKILNDDTKIGEYDIDEKKFVVIMVTKPQNSLQEESTSAGAMEAAAKPASQTPVKVPTPKEKTDETTEPKESSESSDTSLPSVNVQASNTSAAECALLLSTDYEKTVSQIMEMGYDRDDVERALRASFNNPDRAVEYLLSGMIPNKSAEPVEEPHGESQPNTIQIPPGNKSEPLAFLRFQPQFHQARQAIQRNPQLLTVILQQIGQSNPQLLLLIYQNRETFVRMLEEPTASGGQSSNTAAPASAGSGGGGDGSSAAAESAALSGAGGLTFEPSIGGGQVTSTQVSPQDREAIERIFGRKSSSSSYDSSQYDYETPSPYFTDDSMDELPPQLKDLLKKLKKRFCSVCDTNLLDAVKGEGEIRTIKDVMKMLIKLKCIYCKWSVEDAISYM